MKKEKKRQVAAPKATRQEDFFAALSKEHQCTILITCTDPKKDGSLDIEMTYTGKDPGLACFMIEKAQEKLEEDFALELRDGSDDFYHS